jgi:hypothetical protein
MSEPKRGDQLIDQLWPCPPPPRDMAARVLAALAEESPELAAPPPSPPPAQRRRWSPRRIASMGAAAAALVLIGWWATARWNFDSAAGQGQLVATAPQTVNIGARAAAAAESGADLAWSVTGKRARVDQRRGSVFYRVHPGGPFHVMTPAGDVEVTGTCFRVTLAAGATGPAATTLVSVLEGSVKVHTDVGEMTVTVGQTARLSRGQAPESLGSSSTPSASSAEQLQERVARAEARLRELENQVAQSEREAARPAPRPRPAALLLPWSPRLRVYGDRLGSSLKQVSLALATKGQGAEPIAVQVARDPRFEQEIWSGVVRDGFVTVPAPERGDLYWRRRGDKASAGHVRFLPDRAPAPVRTGSPHNVVSETHSNTTVHFQGAAPPALTLTWSATAGAQRYRVQIFRAGDPGGPIFERTVSDTRCTVEPGRLREGGYVWNAQPLDAAGTAVGPGRMNKLDLAYDNALDALAISRLEARSGRERGFDVAGTAPLGARLFVNGKPTSLDDKGRFSLRLDGAPPLLVFRVLARDGAESYWVKSTKPGS